MIMIIIIIIMITMVIIIIMIIIIVMKMIITKIKINYICKGLILLKFKWSRRSSAKHDNHMAYMQGYNWVGSNREKKKNN